MKMILFKWKIFYKVSKLLLEIHNLNTKDFRNTLRKFRDFKLRRKEKGFSQSVHVWNI